MTVVPDFRQASAIQPLAMLKQQCDNAKPLGLAKCNLSSELMVIFDGEAVLGPVGKLFAHAIMSEMACFVNKHGVPTRSAGYVRWESKADAFAQRGHHILLFSPHFVEIREVNTGRLVQALPGEDVRLLHAGRRSAPPSEGVLCARRSSDGVREQLVELLQTAEIEVSDAGAPAVWEEWDMVAA
jgi:hypothetical protein